METATGNTLNIVDIEECIIRNSRSQYMPLASVMIFLEKRQIVANKYLECPQSNLVRKEEYGKIINSFNTQIMQLLSIPISNDKR